MKINKLPQLILITLFIISQAKTFAQMGINSTGTPPASNAMLDVSSTTKGVLMPRMTTAQRTALAHTKGLTVFDITTNNYWYSDGSAWIPITNAAAGTGWALTGNNIFNNNTGNVGIGTTTPVYKFSVVTPTNFYGLTHSDGNVTMGSWLTATTAQFGTKSNHPLEFFTNNSLAQMTILQNGNVGIGTTTPIAKLDINNTILQTGLRIKNTAGYSAIDIDAFNGDAALILSHNGVQNWLVKNSIQDNFEIYEQGKGQRFMIEHGTGRIGFNTITPQSNLHISPNGAGNILIGTDKNTGGYTNLEMGISAQSSGYSYLQSTKASGSAYGTLKLNPSGGDVTFTGNVGIGTNTPFSPLDVVQPSSINSQAFRIVEPGNIWGISINGGFYHFFHNAVNRSWIDYTDGSYNSVSDLRLKKNVEEINTVLDKVLQLKAKKYNFIDGEETAKKSTGFISQEVLGLFPELVSSFKRNETLYHGINYAGFSVIAIKAIQEQQVMIATQQKTIDYLIGEMEKLKTSVAIIQQK